MSDEIDWQALYEVAFPPAEEPVQPSLAPVIELKPRCTATSKTTGERCKRRPHPGSNVCVKHGAAIERVLVAE